MELSLENLVEFAEGQAWCQNQDFEGKEQLYILLLPHKLLNPF